jgi:hypothetical protein
MVATMIAAAYFTAGTFAYAATVFAVNFALSMIVTRVFGQDQQGPQDSGTRQQVPPSSSNAIPIVYGDAYLGGTFVDAVLTTDQKTMYYVIAVSCISPNGQFTFDLKKCYYGDRLITFAASGSVNSVDIENGGTGYAVGNLLTIQGGTPTTATQLTVTAVSSGAITSVSISTAGSYGYGLTPNNPATVTGGAGTGAKFVLGYTSYGPTVQALTDEAGNIDTTIGNSTSLQISLYTSTAAGTITRLNTTDFPSTVMGGVDIDPDLRWTGTRQMNGLAFAIVRLFYNQDAGTTSLSPITFAAKHYLNGTGAAKPGDVWYDYITNVAYGGAVGTSFVDATSATALNSYADQTITFTRSTGGSTTQARYRMNGVLDAGQTVLSNLDKIMTCSDSWMAYNAALGQWSIVINKAETTSYAFDDDNIIGEVRVSATDITQSINQVEAKFPDKGARDQPNFVNIETPSILRYPNEPDNKYSVTYDLCNDSVQAQYLANRILEQAREDLIVSFSTTYYGIQVDAGNVVSVTNADYGWTNKLFRVVKVNEASLPDGSLGAKLELSEYSAAVYDDATITQYTPVPNSDLPSVIYFSPLSAPTVTANNATSPIPNFNVQVAIPATGRVTYGELYYTSSPTPTANDWRLLSTAGRVNGEPQTPGTTYTFTNQVLPTGASTSATYYFSYIVGNDLARSTQSPTSAAFTWTPTGATGPAGDNGLTALTAYLVQAQNLSTPTFTTPTSGATAPAGWSLTTPSVAVGQVLWYIQGRYNNNAVTVDGVGANTTAWTGPIAASVFQDIRSDNWNGSNPPVAATPATWGTAGYYIQRNTGDMFLNSIYARGIAKFDGANSASGGTYALVANSSIASQGGVIGYSSAIFTGAIAGYGSSTAFGGYFDSSGSQAALACSRSGSGSALQVNGPMTITNSTVVTNLNANYLQGYTAGDFLLAGGTAANSSQLGGYAASTYSRVFATNSGDANPSSSRIVLNGNTSTGIAGAYVGTSGSGDTVLFTVQTTSPSDVRLKEEIKNSDLGLDFVNKLRPVSYKLIADPKHQKGYGFIADEVEDLIGLDSSLVYHEPDWQVGDQKGFKTIHYPSYIAILTKAIQELSAEVAALKAKG